MSPPRNKKPDLLGTPIVGKDFETLRRLAKKYGHGEVDAALRIIHGLPVSRPGAPKDWGDFELLMLWARVTAYRKGRKPSLGVGAACEIVSRRSGRFKGSKSGIVRRYYEAKKLLKADAELRAEAEQISAEMQLFDRSSQRH
jgi:hypothetical protein